MDGSSFGLSLLPQKVREATGGKVALTYAQVYRDVVSGRIPGRHSRGRWEMSETDVPAIVAHYKAQR